MTPAQVASLMRVLRRAMMMVVRWIDEEWPEARRTDKVRS